jgi:hypothetical protein
MPAISFLQRIGANPLKGHFIQHAEGSVGRVWFRERHWIAVKHIDRAEWHDLRRLSTRQLCLTPDGKILWKVK